MMTTTSTASDTITEARARLLHVERNYQSIAGRTELAREAALHMSAATLVQAYCAIMDEEHVSLEILCNDTFRHYFINDQLRALAAGCAAYPALEQELVRGLLVDTSERCFHRGPLPGLFTRTVYETLFNSSRPSCTHVLRLTHARYLELQLRVATDLDERALATGTALAASWEGTFASLVATTRELDQRT
jgi:hypothetical protein